MSGAGESLRALVQAMDALGNFGDKREKRTREGERVEKSRERESCRRGWWRRRRHRRCIVPMKEQGSWPWWPWSDPGEKAVREREKKKERK
jgi:hypothetical protein